MPRDTIAGAGADLLVLIPGAGIAGKSLALRLRQRGLALLSLERFPYRAKRFVRSAATFRCARAMQQHTPLRGGRSMNGQTTGWRPPRRFSVTVQHLARPPLPWTWAIYEEDAADPVHRSSRFYRSAEEAWAVGRAMLTRLADPIHGMRKGAANRSGASEDGPISG